MVGQRSLVALLAPLAVAEVAVEESCLVAGSRVIAESVELCNSVSVPVEELAAFGGGEGYDICVDFSTNALGFDCGPLDDWGGAHRVVEVAAGPQELTVGVARGGVFLQVAAAPFVKETFAEALVGAWRSYDAAARRRHVVALFLGRGAHVALVRGDGFVEEASSVAAVVGAGDASFGPDCGDVAGVGALVESLVGGLLGRTGVPASEVGAVVWVRTDGCATAKRAAHGGAAAALGGADFEWYEAAAGVFRRAQCARRPLFTVVVST